MAAVRRIVIGIHGSLGSLQALRFGTELARTQNVQVVPVCAWVPPGGDLAERRYPSPELRKVWRDEACRRLSAAFDDGLGGVPSDVALEPMVVRGEAGPVLVDVASADGDLLVIGTGRRGWLRRATHHSVGRYCLAHARCPVLAVPPSGLMEFVGTGLRSWSARRHVTVPGLGNYS